MDHLILAETLSSVNNCDKNIKTFQKKELHQFAPSGNAAHKCVVIPVDDNCLQLKCYKINPSSISLMDNFQSLIINRIL